MIGHVNRAAHATILCQPIDRGIVAPTFRWISQYTNYCVTVVQTDDAAGVLAAFGGEQGIRGGIEEAFELYHNSARHWPVVRIVDADGWCLAIEMDSFQGLRPPVLARLSADTRAAVLALDHLPEHRMAYAENGEVAGPVRALDPSSPERDQFERVSGTRLGDSKPIDFLHQICGFPIEDDLVTFPGLVGAILPLLPSPTTVNSRVHSERDAKLAALVASGTDEQLWPVVSRHVKDMLEDAGVSTEHIRFDGHLSDDSPTGKALRKVLAEEWMITASPTFHLQRSEIEAIRGRVHAASAAVALLRGGPRHAVAEMSHHRPGTLWQEQLLEELAGIDVAPTAAATVAAQLANYQAVTNRAIRIPPSLPKRRDD